MKVDRGTSCFVLSGVEILDWLLEVWLVTMDGSRAGGQKSTQTLTRVTGALYTVPEESIFRGVACLTKVGLAKT